MTSTTLQTDLKRLCVVGLDESQAASIIIDEICNRTPFIIEGLSLGSCTNLWNADYLRQKCGHKLVTIHRSKQKQLDFVSKNFLYEAVAFSTLLDYCFHNSNDPKVIKNIIRREYNENHCKFKLAHFECKLKGRFLFESGGNEIADYVYLRVTSAECGRSQVAVLNKDFPEIASDFKLPSFIDLDRFFSSILRVTSTDVQLWTHYDVLDNVLCQIKGSKRIILFPPTDVPYLYLVGDKSKVLDVLNPDLLKFPEFAKATCYSGILTEGEALFIPAMWFHNTIALSFSIAINVFWKNLDSPLYSPKDLYGNKDLLPASSAFDGLNKALSRIKSLPVQYRQFYQLMMIEKIKSELLKE